MKMKNSMIVLSIGVLCACDGTGSSGSSYTEETYSESSSQDVAEAVDQQSYQEVTKSAEEIKRELWEREAQSPLNFLRIEDATYRKNLLGEFVLEGKVANYAQYARFKDAIFEVKFYTKTDTYLGSKKVSLIEFFNPQKSRTFRLKVLGPNKAVSVGYELVKASVAD